MFHSFAVRFSLLTCLLLAIGCNQNPAGPAGTPSKAGEDKSGAKGAFIKADPNPVPQGKGTGITVVSWDTGNGTYGEVYVATDGQPEQRFQAGMSGSAEAAWIYAGSYEFRLYAGKDRQNLLASVKVTREK